MGYNDAAPLYEERVRRILSDVGSGLKARQTKVLLSTEIRKLNREIAFAGDRREVLDDELDRLRREVELLDPQVAVMVGERARLLGERDALAAKVRELEAGIEEKIASLPDLAVEIERLEAELPEYPERIKELNLRREEIAERQEVLEARSRPIFESVQSLQTEISVISSTRDIIAGLVPKDIDQEVFDTIHDDTQARLDAYMDDVRDAIASVRKHQEMLSADLDTLRKDRAQAADRAARLKKVLEGMDEAEFADRSLDALSGEVDALRLEMSSLEERRTEAATTTETVRAESAALEADLRKAGERLAEVETKHARLALVEQEMLALPDVDAAMAGFQTQGRAMEEETKVTLALLHVGETTIAPLRDLRGKLEAEQEQMRDLFDRLERIEEG
uniref:Magnetosome protein Mad22 n=1 Tax=delta proteobacterium ML-1 TaxID=947513 RepID=U5IGK2_9DELT|nr:magnetosome protein Mad22 [delta proteobacterium ML-1]